MCGGNDCVFESNVIEHTNYECDDSGAFYTCARLGLLCRPCLSVLGPSRLSCVFWPQL